MIRGLFIAPAEPVKVIEFEEGYEKLNELVGGWIEMPYLFDDVDIVINEEGKLLGLDPNMLVYSNGQLVDVIVGNIVVVDHNEEGETISLSDEKIEKYKEIFKTNNLFL